MQLRSARAVGRVAVMTHGRPQTIGPALERVEEAARRAGVELLLSDEEREKHRRAADGGAGDDPDLALVLGGDGTMLRALNRYLGTRVPVIGVNFGRVGFLASIRPDELDAGLARAFAGDVRLVELPTLRTDVGGESRAAVNDVVARSSDIGRMVELGWSIGGEELGRQPCDGIICATPSGSTAYNLSNGGPVLVWGLEAMAISFVAPHSLDARPLVVPKGRDLVVRNETPDVAVTVIVDGHPFAEVERGGSIAVALGDSRSLLAVLPESTFFRRYRETFAS